MLEAGAPRTALGGFFLSGMLFAFLGSILPVWGYHLTELYVEMGNHFLAFNLGLFAANRLAAWLLPKKGVRWCLVGACAAACAAIICLSYVPPPMAIGYRLGGLLALGVSSGLMHGAIFQAITPIYRHDPAATGNLAGIFFGLGSLAMALIVASTYYVYTVASTLVLISFVPLAFAVGYRKLPEQPAPPPFPKLSRTLQDLKNPIAIQFGLLLLVHSANEWAIGGWLAIFLTQRLGLSPSTALLFLALYYGALVVGRIVAQTVLPRVRQGKVLFVSSLAAMFGFIVLSFTDNRFGVVSGILFIGVGFAPVYPLVAARIGSRFPYYDPALYHGIFSVAFTGALLTTAGIGYLAAWAGVKWILLVPLIGIVLVGLLLLLIWIEQKLAGLSTQSSTDN